MTKRLKKLRAILDSGWVDFNSSLGDLTEEELTEMLDLEKTDNRRASYIDRIVMRITARVNDRLKKELRES